MEIVNLLLSSAVIATIIAILGRLYMDKKFETLKHELSLTATMRELTLKSQINFKERQLSEYYGPIYARLMRGKKLDKLWRQGKLERVKPEVLALFVQANEENVQTILNKSDLTVGNELPDSYIDYLVHVAVWDPLLRRNPPEIPPYEDEGFEDGKFPPEFEESIKKTMEELKREISEWYKKDGLEQLQS